MNEFDDFGMYISDLMAKEHPKLARRKAEERFESYYNELACRFLQQELQDSSRNIVFSPLSIYTLLAIVADAADGDARDEIIELLFAGTNKTCFDERREQLSHAKNMSMANAVYVQEKIKGSINPEFPKLLKEQYNGQLFATEDIISDLNRWVRKATKGMINEIADDSMKNMLACILNAVAFEEQWKKPYKEDDVYEDEFQAYTRLCEDVSMLHSNEEEYIESEYFTGFVKPYKGGEFDFMALKPKKYKDSYPLKAEPETLDFTRLYRQRTLEDVRVALPEFRYDFSESLKELCDSYGIRTIFSDHADFSPMSSEWLKVDDILHKAHIEVDRKGTKAAAVTASIMVAGALPDFDRKRVILDRPFFYAIMHKSTGLPVFVGAVNALPIIP